MYRLLKFYNLEALESDCSYVPQHKALSSEIILVASARFFKGLL